MQLLTQVLNRCSGVKAQHLHCEMLCSRSMNFDIWAFRRKNGSDPAAILLLIYTLFTLIKGSSDSNNDISLLCSSCTML